MSYTMITAKLKSRTGIHIGSGQGNELTDALIRRDGAGQPLIPGTALAGALRSLLTRLAPRLGAGECIALSDGRQQGKDKSACGCGVCRLFGDINPGDEENSQAAASRLLVFNAVLISPSGGSSTIRDGVGINRVTGAAARAGAVKFDLEVLPAGTEFQVRLELRGQEEQDEQLLAAALAEWQAGRAWLGGRVARGLGAFDLTGLTFAQLDLNHTDNLLAYLKADQPETITTPVANWLTDQIAAIHLTATAHPYAARSWFRVDATLKATGPLLTNDTVSAGLTNFDHAPALLQWGDWTQPVLAGSGLRGVIRSHAERLARTLATLKAADKNEFLRTCPACSPVAGKAEQPLASCDSLLRQNEVPTDTEVGDEQLCLGCRLFGSSWRGSRLLLEDAAFAGQEAPKLKMLDFLAIDRFTGGGADGAKFDALALWKPTFTLRLHLENPEPWELGWLALVLRDLQSQWLTVGMGAAKGFGRVKLEDLDMRLGYLMAEDLVPFNLSAGTNDEMSGMYRARPVLLDEALPWIGEFKQLVAAFQRQDGLVLTADSYFDDVTSQLYPKEVIL